MEIIEEFGLWPSALDYSRDFGYNEGVTAGVFLK